MASSLTTIQAHGRKLGSIGQNMVSCWSYNKWDHKIIYKIWLWYRGSLTQREREVPMTSFAMAIKVWHCFVTLLKVIFGKQSGLERWSLVLSLSHSLVFLALIQPQWLKISTQDDEKNNWNCFAFWIFFSFVPRKVLLKVPPTITVSNNIYSIIDDLVE